MRIHEIAKSPATALIQHLKTTCSHTWQAFTETNRPLYRGSRAVDTGAAKYGEASYSTVIRRKKVESGKTDTGPKTTEIINDYFIDKFGYPFRFGMFATGSFGIARDYGAVSVIFPHDGFVFCVGNTTDLYGKLSPQTHIDIEGSHADDVARQQRQNELVKMLEDLNYQAGQSSNVRLLKQALNSGNEITIYPADGSQIPYTWINLGFFRDQIWAPLQNL